jgi:hypothetical protein
MKQIAELDEHPIVVLKRPAWYNEVFSYPKLPKGSKYKVIVLVRDAYPTVCSMRKMSFGRFASLVSPVVNRWLVHHWTSITERIYKLSRSLGKNAYLVRYEDIVEKPLETTKELFSFIGSSRRTGVKKYNSPGNFKWKWGKDDISEKIRSLKVKAPKPHGYKDRSLLKSIRRSRNALRVREMLDYPELPPA